MKNKKEPKENKISPEDALKDFIKRNEGGNRHYRRMMGKMIGIKIKGTQVPEIKDEK